MGRTGKRELERNISSIRRTGNEDSSSSWSKNAANLDFVLSMVQSSPSSRDYKGLARRVAKTKGTKG